jgi:predicted RNase H-like HicB family nuclease
MVISVDASVTWQVTRSRDGGYVGRCDALKVTAQGETYAELMSTIDEVQNELMLDLLAEGELEAFLSRHGWRPLNPIPARGDIPPHGVRFDLPFTVTQERRSDAHAA